MYQKEEVLQYIKEYLLEQSEFNLSLDQIEKIVPICIEADIEYMLQTGLLKNNAGTYEITNQGFYDDDDAFSQVLNKLKKNKIKIPGIDLEEFVDDYLQAHESFLEEKGLLGWDE